MNLRRYLSALRRYWLLVAVLAVIGAVAGFATGSSARAASTSPATQYYATATLLIDPSASSADSGVGRTTSPSLAVGLDALYVATPDVAKRAAKTLHHTGNVDSLSATVTTTSDTLLGTLSITATGTKPKATAATANAFAAALLAYLQEKSSTAHANAVEAQTTRVAALQRAVDAAGPASSFGVANPRRDAAEAAHQDALTDLATLQADTPKAGLILAVPAVADRGTPPVVQPIQNNGSRATSPTPTTTTQTRSTSHLGKPARGLAAGFAGLLLGLLLVLGLEMFDPRLHTVEDAEAAFALPVLAEIPKRKRRGRANRKPASGRRGSERVAEAYRQLRALVFASNPVRYRATTNGTTNGTSRTSRTIVVTSATEAEGTTGTVANLAVAIGESGRYVTALSMRFDHDELPEYFSVPTTPGLAEALERNHPSLVDMSKPTKIKGVTVVPSGVANGASAELVERACQLLRNTPGGPDVIVVDAPPLLVSSTASDLAAAADVVLIVCRVARTTRGQAAEVSERLALLGAVVAGIVMLGTKGHTRRSSSLVGRSAVPKPVSGAPAETHEGSVDVDLASAVDPAGS